MRYEGTRQGRPVDGDQQEKGEQEEGEDEQKAEGRLTSATARPRTPRPPGIPAAAGLQPPPLAARPRGAGRRRREGNEGDLYIYMYKRLLYG